MKNKPRKLCSWSCLAARLGNEAGDTSLRHDVFVLQLILLLLFSSKRNLFFLAITSHLILLKNIYLLFNLQMFENVNCFHVCYIARYFGRFTLSYDLNNTVRSKLCFLSYCVTLEVVWFKYVLCLIKAFHFLILYNSILSYVSFYCSSKKNNHSNHIFSTYSVSGNTVVLNLSHLHNRLAVLNCFIDEGPNAQKITHSHLLRTAELGFHPRFTRALFHLTRLFPTSLNLDAAGKPLSCGVAGWAGGSFRPDVSYRLCHLHVYHSLPFFLSIFFSSSALSFAISS